MWVCPCLSLLSLEPQCYMLDHMWVCPCFSLLSGALVLYVRSPDTASQTSRALLLLLFILVFPFLYFLLILTQVYDALSWSPSNSRHAVWNSSSQFPWLPVLDFPHALISILWLFILFSAEMLSFPYLCTFYLYSLPIFYVCFLMYLQQLL